MGCAGKLIIATSNVLRAMRKSEPGLERLVARLLGKISFENQESKTSWPTYFDFEAGRGALNTRRGFDSESTAT